VLASTDAGWHELMIARIATTIELAASFVMAYVAWASRPRSIEIDRADAIEGFENLRRDTGFQPVLAMRDLARIVFGKFRAD
jgi:hypothetical protein